jgi:hypothetical protein
VFHTQSLPDSHSKVHGAARRYYSAEMYRMRFALGLVVIATATLVATLPAAGKDGVRATLTTRVPLDAPAGAQLRVAWTLASRDGHPFGGGGIFVRLLSESHAGAQTTYVRCSGHCSARVRVPKGGIRDIQIGIRGYTTTGAGDLLFPITNDPVPR